MLNNQRVNDDSPAIYGLTQRDPGEKPTQIAGIYGCPSMKKNGSVLTTSDPMIGRGICYPICCSSTHPGYSGAKSKITQPSKSRGNRFLLVVVGYPNPFYIVSRFYRPSSMSATFVHHKKKLTNLEQHVLDMLMLFICCFRLVSHFSPMQVERVKVFTSFYVFETNVAAVTCKKYQQL